MLRAVVFDVGNVIVDWNVRAFYARFITDPARLDWFLANVVTPDWHFQHDMGRPFADTSAELIARFPAEADLIRLFGPRFNETIVGPIPGMIELVEQLAARGVPLFAITNFAQEFWLQFRPEWPVFDHFIDIVVSGAERLAKPDPAIYQLALRRFGLAPGEAIFIDDRADNVAAAQANGFAGHLFEGAAGLNAELVRLGLLPQ
ncbi:HAD family phosphatase [Sandarakinorhabdus sp.]|uniref:HAD family hydrolase n=1 Tax=Sandarakinorhabdus sp. TaxID=1916663 RepID=UPI00286E2436|nr:HAD family phosphatase [Sandarakinorhabdus sp.]